LGNSQARIAQLWVILQRRRLTLTGLPGVCQRRLLRIGRDFERLNIYLGRLFKQKRGELGMEDFKGPKKGRN